MVTGMAEEKERAVMRCFRFVGNWELRSFLQLHLSSPNRGYKGYHEKDDLESVLCAMLVTLTTCITITGWKFRFGSKPFEVGQKVRLVKEPDNEYADCQKTFVGASIALPCPLACEKTYPEKALLRQVGGRPVVAPTYLIDHECVFSTRRSMSRS